ncbi:MAG: hypothetical protein KAJ19_26570 [Gammaproteobacteria bacterium]|nr:hypothetical protein [Gammaproteobacteria bacterium]
MGVHNKSTADKPFKSIYCLIILMVLSAGCIDSNTGESNNSLSKNTSISHTAPIENIQKTLIGHNLTYFDIAGNQRYYSISKKDIGAIEKSKFDTEAVWIVKVGSGMEWEIVLNATGEQIIDEKQLFKT